MEGEVDQLGLGQMSEEEVQAYLDGHALPLEAVKRKLGVGRLGGRVGGWVGFGSPLLGSCTILRCIWPLRLGM